MQLRTPKLYTSHPQQEQHTEEKTTVHDANLCVTCEPAVPSLAQLLPKEHASRPA
jgi:hypothetical protein